MRVINGSTASLLSWQSLPLLRAILTSLSCLACRLGKGFIPYVIPIRRNINIMIVTLTGDNTSLINGISGVSGNNMYFGGHGSHSGGTGDRRNQSMHDTGNDYYSPSSGSSNGAPMTMEKMKERLPQLKDYETIVGQLLTDKPVPLEPSDAHTIAPFIDPRVRNRALTARELDTRVQPPSLYALEQAWVLAGRNSTSDLNDWMHRLTSELIRQSPSPVIRTCSSLSKAYPPWPKSCCLCALPVFGTALLGLFKRCGRQQQLGPSRAGLKVTSYFLSYDLFFAPISGIHGYEGQATPLDVTLLARCAENANMYAKALRYRELQFNSVNIVPTGECIESLITVNNQLGSDDRAIGVLEHVISNFNHISVEPL